MILMPNELLRNTGPAPHQGQKFFRDGIQLEKGAVISEKRIQRNLELYQRYMDFYSQYPDCYLDLIKQTTSKFEFKFFQRIFLRACVRYGRVLTIAPRAAGKSFICILALLLICIFRPGTRVFICSPGKAQSAKIGSQKIHQIWELWPLLKEEIVGNGNFGSDYITLNYKNGSQFTIMTPLNSTRGNRANCGILDEFRF